MGCRWSYLRQEICLADTLNESAGFLEGWGGNVLPARWSLENPFAGQLFQSTYSVSREKSEIWEKSEIGAPVLEKHISNPKYETTHLNSK